MNWSFGNYWRAQINLENYFEYKFVFIENDKVKKWEGGANRVFCVSKITNDLNESENAGKEVITIDGKYSEIYEFDTKTNILRIICKWKA